MFVPSSDRTLPVFLGIASAFFFFFLAIVYLFMALLWWGMGLGHPSPRNIFDNILDNLPLQRRILDTLPITKVGSTDNNGNCTQVGSTDDNGNDCVICWDSLVENDIVRELPPCSHIFHRQCIDKWFQRHSCCPICRRSLRGYGRRSLRG
ncbi:hypothetical protein AMTRI_Chr08g161460 [Amborella trichopoda]